MTLWQTIENGFRNWEQMNRDEKQRHVERMQQLAEKDMADFSEEDRRSMEGRQHELLAMIGRDISRLEKEVDNYLVAKTGKAA